MQLQFFKLLIIILIICLIFETSYLSAQQRVKRRRSSRIKQPRSRRNRNPTTVVVPRLKELHYAKTPVYPLPDSIIDKLVTWHAGKYHDILNHNGKVTN
ncbi:hypothetical protein F8M41_005825 [Gigaspora margarita]|uniref:Uncharacterized protein n=1 Tax=Gigaspora margarita TaxID=4874 RepID=A0A8H3X8T9_GIGMA|nr:hypothetical protein F8M41_005825 [Gigaspora margarita]